MKNSKIFDMVITAMFVAIILLMSYVPVLGYIQFGLVSATLIHIPVIVFALLYGTKRGGYMGIVFGLSSLLIAFIRPGTPFDFAFQNPLVSVLPRFLFGLSIYPIFMFINKLHKSNVASALVTSFLSTFVHGILTITCMYIIIKLGWFFDQQQLALIRDIGETNIFKVILPILGSNTIIEALLATLIAPPIYRALRTLSESRK